MLSKNGKSVVEGQLFLTVVHDIVKAERRYKGYSSAFKKRFEQKKKESAKNADCFAGGFRTNFYCVIERVIEFELLGLHQFSFTSVIILFRMEINFALEKGFGFACTM